MSRDRDIRAEMSQLIGDPTVRKAVRYLELKALLEQRKKRRGQMALKACMEEVDDWGPLRYRAFPDWNTTRRGMS